jgi:hypothetical protein
MDDVCKKDNVCGHCNEMFFTGDVLQLKESGTGYSEHNTVETNKLNPYFKY